MHFYSVEETPKRFLCGRRHIYRKMKRDYIQDEVKIWGDEIKVASVMTSHLLVDS